MSVSDNRHIQDRWSSQAVFILAVAGSAVGLGNVWRFPYIVGEYGGGAFILIYFLAILLIMPIMASEILIGQRGRRSPVYSMGGVSEEFGLSRHWRGVGFMGVLAGLVILSYYSVIAGWTIGYFFRASSGEFQQLTSDGVSYIFNEFTGSAEKMLAWHTIFMVASSVVMAHGIHQGLERLVKYVMPLLLVLFVGLLIYEIFEGAFKEAVAYMFVFDFSKLTWQSVLAAIGQAFFSLGIGMGAMMAYGSYLPRGVPIVKTTFIVVLIDTLIAIVAGLIVFSLVFQYGAEPEQGPGLVFTTLPLIFGNIPGGGVLGGVFFFLLFIAAWTSAVSLIEPCLAWLSDSFSVNRGRAASVIGFTAWLLGLLTIFSFSDAENWTVFGHTVFASFDYLASKILLPVGGLLIAVFAGWRLPSAVLREGMGISSECYYRIWRFMLRYLSPIAIAIVLLGQLIFAA